MNILREVLSFLLLLPVLVLMQIAYGILVFGSIYLFIRFIDKLYKLLIYPWRIFFLFAVAFGGLLLLYNYERPLFYLLTWVSIPFSLGYIYQGICFLKRKILKKERELK